MAADVTAQSAVVAGFVPYGMPCWYESDGQGTFNVNKQPEFATLVVLFEDGLPTTSGIILYYIGAVLCSICACFCCVLGFKVLRDCYIYW